MHGAAVKPLHPSLGKVFDDFFPVEKHCSVCGGIDSRYHVECGGFSRSVGANEGNDFSLVHLQRKGVYRHNATKLHGDIVHRKNIVCRNASFHGYFSSSEL